MAATFSVTRIQMPPQINCLRSLTTNRLRVTPEFHCKPESTISRIRLSHGTDCLWNSNGTQDMRATKIELPPKTG